MTGVRARWRAVREFCAVQVELQERLILLNRPWEQELLHWSEGELHGRMAPPADGRLRGVTAGGWCACHRERPTRGGRNAVR